MMDEKRASEWMERAFELAELTLKAGEVPVGCILVHESENVSFTGGNEVSEFKNATRHAELVAFDKAAEYSYTKNIPEAEFFKNCTLFVTVEPCIMCANAISQLNLKHVYFGCKNERFGGCDSVDNTIFDVSFTANFEDSAERAVFL